MVEGNQRITRAAELHRRLLKLENFDFRPCGRDMALYQHIKEEMRLPDGQFLQALESSCASAADYMRALMKAALPFSGMYSDLLDYCRRSGTRHSRQGVEIEWSMKIDEVDVSVSLEHLRIFEQITSQVQPDVKKWSAAKNEVMEWLSKRALPETALGKTYEPLHRSVESKADGGHWVGIGGADWCYCPPTALIGGSRSSCT